MINLQIEHVIPLREAPNHLPKREGKKTHLSTLYRWAVTGTGGTRLETIKVGGRRYTSLEALQRFSERLSEQRDDEAPAARRSPERAHRTAETLRRARI